MRHAPDRFTQSMPYCACPICEQTFHLRVTRPRDEWERDHVTVRAADGTPLLLCLSCWKSLRSGDLDLNSLDLGAEVLRSILDQVAAGESS